MKNKKWCQSLITGVFVILLAGCGKQEVNQENGQEVSIRKIAEITGSSVSAGEERGLLVQEENTTGMMVFDELTVTMDFPDGWEVRDSRDDDSDYQSIYGNEYDQSLRFSAMEVNKPLLELEGGKIGSSMDTKSIKILKKYIRETVTNEADGYEGEWTWQDTTYKTVEINGQNYIKVSGVTKEKKDAGDAHVGYFTIINGVVLEFMFDLETAVVEQTTQSVFDNIMNSITYTY
ncbi:MAG: hypothetical protein NC293_02150 [Roseburia sp.]|nr:hypothetical protein [Roseburia sp.]